MRKDSLGENHKETLISLQSLGYCCSLQGKFQKAIEALEKVYRKRGRCIRSFNDMVYFLDTLAMNYIKAKRYSDAKDILEELYSFVCDNCGPNDPYAVEVKIKLNDVCKKCMFLF